MENYPIAFITPANQVIEKSKKEISADGTPRYVINPNSDATYCLQDCMKDYKPIYSRKELQNAPVSDTSKADSSNTASPK